MSEAEEAPKGGSVLNSEPTTSFYGKQVADLYIGNTGLKFETLEPDEWVMHFMPEGNISKVEGSEIAFAQFLAKGLYRLSNLWQNPGELEKFGLTKPAKIVGLANEPMYTIFKKLLGAKSCKEIQQITKERRGKKRNKIFI